MITVKSPHPTQPYIRSINFSWDIPFKNAHANTYFIWQDFGLSGIPCGVIHSYNKEVLNAQDKIDRFHNVPSITQLQLSSVISDLGNETKWRGK